MAKKTEGDIRAWLFLGPEIGEKYSAIDEIRKKLAAIGSQSSAPAELDETVYYAGETPVPAMVSCIQNGSLFAESRLFLVKCAEQIRKKEDIDLLASEMACLPNDVSLILISEETSVARGLEKEIPPANKRIFWELLDNRKIEWVTSFFRREGYSISADGVETILELVVNNTAALRQECSRLALILGKSTDSPGGKVPEITGELVEKWLAHTREESAFTLFSRIAAGDFPRSLESIRVLLAAKEAPPAIFAGLASCFRKLINYLGLKASGTADEGEYRKIGVSSPGAKRDYAAAGRRYDSAGAESCLALTAEYDLLLRSALSFPQQILMDEYLYKIHSLGTRP